MAHVNKYQAALTFAEQYIERCREIQNLANSENFLSVPSELCRDQSPVIVLDDDEDTSTNHAVTSTFPPILEIEDSMDETEISDIHITGTTVLKEWIDISELDVMPNAQDEKNDNHNSYSKQIEEEENQDWADLNVEEDIKAEEPIEEQTSEKETIEDDHSGDEKHKCKQCPYKTNWKNNLTKHVISRHLSSEEIKWLQCAHCPYKGKTREYLQTHLQTNHEQFIQWLTCPHCPSRFKLKQAYQEHILRRHTADKDIIKWFKCEQCTFKCKLRSTLKQHIRIHHDITWHLCEKCNYKSKTTKGLRLHTMNKHIGHDN